MLQIQEFFFVFYLKFEIVLHYYWLGASTKMPTDLFIMSLIMVLYVEFVIAK